MAAEGHVVAVPDGASADDKVAVPRAHVGHRPQVHDERLPLHRELPHGHGQLRGRAPGRCAGKPDGGLGWHQPDLPREGHVDQPPDVWLAHDGELLRPDGVHQQGRAEGLPCAGAAGRESVRLPHDAALRRVIPTAVPRRDSAGAGGELCGAELAAARRAAGPHRAEGTIHWPATPALAARADRGEPAAPWDGRADAGARREAARPPRGLPGAGSEARPVNLRYHLAVALPVLRAAWVVRLWGRAGEDTGPDHGQLPAGDVVDPDAPSAGVQVARRPVPGHLPGQDLPEGRLGDGAEGGRLRSGRHLADLVDAGYASVQGR
mmetsp:Transcript_2849/g.9604  ORF Transcript_2849/g.9604 Transcript_2849/m.9604 type:complete len:321 (+) Transcript_2849:1311-2273(+)